MSPAPGIDSQRQFYNQRWESASYLKPGKFRRAAQILQAVAELPVSEPRTIELGCGTGWLTSVLGLYGPATGVDFSETAIEAARTAFPHARFLAREILDWDYPRGEFDLVVSHEVLEHVEDQRRYLAVARGLLRVGGYLVLTTPNKSAWEARPEAVRRTYDLQPLENWVTAGQLRALLRREFSVEKLTTILPTNLATGLRRFPCSSRVWRAAKVFGLGEEYQRLILRVGLGVHLIAIARAR
jgi:SAM-dependent methyltransferase